MNNSTRIMILGAWAILNVSCGPAFQISTEMDPDFAADFVSLNPPDTTPGSATPTPAPPPINTDQGIAKKLTANCMSDPTVNACLFWKNPVAQNGATLTVAYSQAADLTDLQTFGVNVRGYDNSGFLKNTSIEILAGGLGATDAGTYVQVPQLNRVSTTSGNFKFRNDNDPDLKLVQVAAFYWLQTQIEFMEARVGKWFPKDKGTRVQSYSPDFNNAVFTSTGTIIIGNKLNKSFAHYADYVVHEHGHANVHYASQGKIWMSQGTPGADGQCIPGQNIGTVTCCATRNGCAKALNEGLSDYHVVMLFPSQPGFGETAGNAPNGTRTPAGNLTRNPAVNAALTADQAFTVSVPINGTPTSINGEARSMAALYTSIWYELRKNAENLKPGGGREIDQLFSEHLVSLTGADTIFSARDKILAVDVALFAGRNSNLVRQEFTRRGY